MGEALSRPAERKVGYARRRYSDMDLSAAYQASPRDRL